MINFSFILCCSLISAFSEDLDHWKRLFIVITNLLRFLWARLVPSSHSFSPALFSLRCPWLRVDFLSVAGKVVPGRVAAVMVVAAGFRAVCLLRPVPAAVPLHLLFQDPVVVHPAGRHLPGPEDYHPGPVPDRLYHLAAPCSPVARFPYRLPDPGHYLRHRLVFPAPTSFWQGQVYNVFPHPPDYFSGHLYKLQ